MNEEVNPYESPQVVDAIQKDNIPADAIPVAPDNSAFGRDIAWSLIILVCLIFIALMIDDRLYRTLLYAALVQNFVFFVIGVRVLGFFKKLTIVDSLLIRFGVMPITILLWFFKVGPGF